jgi:mRNA-degrading endonuclease RelE of RelBE toxin-antitoxin system
MTNEYKVHIGTEIEGRIGRCRASVRAAVGDNLRNIAVTAAASHARTRAPLKQGPSMRFYVYEGYRIFYQIDARTRRVVVLDFGVVPAG